MINERDDTKDSLWSCHLCRDETNEDVRTVHLKDKKI